MLIDNVRESVRNRINQLSDWVLSKGTITYSSIVFSMGDSNKYLDEFVLLPESQYPYGIKGVGEQWLIFPDRASHTQFIFFGMVEVQKVLFWGRALKDGGEFYGTTYKALSEMTLEELQNFSDPRESLW